MRAPRSKKRRLRFEERTVEVGLRDPEQRHHGAVGQGELRAGRAVGDDLRRGRNDRRTGARRFAWVEDEVCRRSAVFREPVNRYTGRRGACEDRCVPPAVALLPTPIRSPGPPHTESLPVPAMIVSLTAVSCVEPALNALMTAVPDEFERSIRSPPPPTCGLKSRLAPAPPTIVSPPLATLEPKTLSSPAVPSLIVILPAPPSAYCPTEPRLIVSPTPPNTEAAPLPSVTAIFPAVALILALPVWLVKSTMSPLPSPWICTKAAPPLIVSGPPAAPLIVLTATVPTMLSVPADPTRIAIFPAVPSMYVLPDPATTESPGPP